MSGRDLAMPRDWIARANVGELAEDMEGVLDDRFGVYIALLGALAKFELLGENSLLPTQAKICARQVIILRRVLNRPHMRKLAREIEAHKRRTGQ